MRDHLWRAVSEQSAPWGITVMIFDGGSSSLVGGPSTYAIVIHADLVQKLQVQSTYLNEVGSSSEAIPYKRTNGTQVRVPQPRIPVCRLTSGRCPGRQQVDELYSVGDAPAYLGIALRAQGAVQSFELQKGRLDCSGENQ